MLSTLAPARRRLVLTGIAAAVAVVILAGAVVVDQAVTRSRFTPAAQDQPGPVLLVPGYGGSTGGLTRLAAALIAAGRDAHVVSLPDDGVGDLTAAARALGRAADAALTRTGRPSVDVIGYSAGGVVVRLWVRSYGGDSVARRVITLGSPHHGTDLAGAAGSLLPGACPPACQQLEPDSTFLADLNDGDETPRGPTFVSIWTTHDDVVVPPSSAQLDGALNLTVQSVCATDPVNHGGLPRDTTVQSMLLRELAAGPPVRLGRGDCRLSS